MKEKKVTYIVKVFDGAENEVDRATVTAWNRREAYYEVMNKLKTHKLWDTEELDKTKS